MSPTIHSATPDPADAPRAVDVRARLAAIVESSNDAILAKDLTGVVSAWNPAAEHLYGYTAEEMIGRSISTIIPPELAGESTFILAEIAAGRTVPRHDTERVTKSGTRVAVSVSVSPILGEAGAIASTPAVVNAIVDAVRSFGVNDILMPCTPERVWKAIQKGRSVPGEGERDAQPHFDEGSPNQDPGAASEGSDQ